MRMDPHKENPGARAGATGAEIIPFSQGGRSVDNPLTPVQQHPAYREGFDAGRQDMLDELLRGRDVPALFERLGPYGAARLCLLSDAPLDDWSVGFLCDATERTRFSVKQQAKLKGLVAYCLEYGGGQYDNAY